MEAGDSGLERLAVYGTLRPGHPNHHVISDIEGRWFEGSIRGRLLELGWGAALGSPGIVLDDAGDVVDVWVLESPALPHHWDRLDAFEGPSYRRVPSSVHTDDGTLVAFVYVLATPTEP